MFIVHAALGSRTTDAVQEACTSKQESMYTPVTLYHNTSWIRQILPLAFKGAISGLQYYFLLPTTAVVQKQAGIEKVAIDLRSDYSHAF